MPRKGKKVSKKEKRLEKKKKIKEKKRLIKMENLNREIKYGNITRRKHEKNWREFVMKIGREMIGEELEYMWQIFEWTIDVKDCSISVLMDELDKANEQNSFMQHNHIEVVGDWLKKLHENIEDLQMKFSISLENMENDFNEKNSDYMRNFWNIHHDMEKRLHRTEAEHVEIWRYEVIRHIQMIEFLNEAQKDLKDCENAYAEKMKKLAKQCEIFYKIHMDDVEKIEQLSRTLAETRVESKLKKIMYLLDLIKIFKEKLKVLNETGSEHLNKLRKYRDEFYNYLFILKNKLFEDNKVDSNRIKVLVCNAQVVLEHFESIFKKGELLIRTVCVNRRYETFSEKILPYPASEYLMKPPSNHRTVVREKIVLFYQKMAAVDAERSALAEERKMLILEQRKLKKKFEEIYSNFQFPKFKQVKRLKAIDNFENSLLHQY